MSSPRGIGCTVVHDGEQGGHEHYGVGQHHGSALQSSQAEHATVQTKQIKELVNGRLMNAILNSSTLNLNPNPI